MELGRYNLVGITSSIVALPVFQADTLPEERPEWDFIRDGHLAGIRAAFEAIPPGQRIVLFCHDPTALPFLFEEPCVRSRLPQVEMTIIGHLHTGLVLRAARWLAGMPRINWLGHTGRRMSTALREARVWSEFRVQLCPSLSGSELLKDGGWLRLVLDPAGDRPPLLVRHRLWRE
jgi:hypothetical protein